MGWRPDTLRFRLRDARQSVDCSNPAAVRKIVVTELCELPSGHPDYIRSILIYHFVEEIENATYCFALPD
ncbi:hypothetical protein ACFXNW_19315 [Nocardia sp. NPDC059180]|uniref:hypothetical protein n=1 Tax=Nocardia sp. NPDC059180 TaxID=3346761 RepID=UPI00369F6D3A